MHSAASSGHSVLVGTVGPCAKTWWSWRCVVNNKGMRCLLSRLGGLSVVPFRRASSIEVRAERECRH